jgi:hypothetical protein
MFETIWPQFPGYLTAVALGWLRPVGMVDSFRALDIKFRSTAKALKSWSQKFIDNIQLQLAVAKEVMFQLEHAQDHRPLSQEEVTLRHELKFKCLSWPLWHALLPVIIPI